MNLLSVCRAMSDGFYEIYLSREKTAVCVLQPKEVFRPRAGRDGKSGYVLLSHYIKIYSVSAISYISLSVFSQPRQGSVIDLP